MIIPKASFFLYLEFVLYVLSLLCSLYMPQALCISLLINVYPLCLCHIVHHDFICPKVKILSWSLCTELIKADRTINGAYTTQKKNAGQSGPALGCRFWIWKEWSPLKYRRLFIDFGSKICLFICLFVVAVLGIGTQNHYTGLHPQIFF